MATIQGVYVALFGRPADPNGLAFFNGVTKNGADLNGIGDLTSTQEYKDRFKDQTNAQIVNSIYQSLFNRDAESTGLNFFVDALNKGTLNIKNIAIAILDGAQGADKTIVTNKITAADNFTKATDTPVEIATYTGNTAAQAGRDFLKQVTADTATIPTAAATDTAIANIATTVNKGNTFTTAAVTTDVVVGTSTTTNSSDKDDTVTVTQVVPAAGPAANNVTAVGKIDGGFGNDTVKLSTKAGDAGAGAGAVGLAATLNITPEYTGVEKISVTAAGGAGNAGGGAPGNAGGSGDITVALTKATSVTEIVNDSSTIGATGAGGVGAGGSAAVSFTDVALSTKVTLKGGITGATSVSFKDAGGSSDTVSVALDGATVSGTTTLNAVETLNVSNTGTSSIAITADSAKAVNLSGTGTLTFSTTSAVLETVTNTSTGTVTVDVSANDKIKTYTGSAAIDNVTINTSHDNDVVINTGAGTDTLTVVKGTASDKTITLTGGDGSDIFTFGATGNGNSVQNVVKVDTAANLAKSLITISDFNKTSETIKLFASGIAQDKLNNGELGQAAGQTDLLAAVKKAAEFTDKGKFSIFSFGTDTYIYLDSEAAGNNGAAATLSAGDGLIKVTGIAAADLTDSNFQILA